MPSPDFPGPLQPSTRSPRFVQACTDTYYGVMSTMSSSEARAGLPEILDRVSEGEEITITRHGKAVAVVVRPETLRIRRALSLIHI